MPKPTFLAAVGLLLCLSACNTVETSLAIPDRVEATCGNAADLHSKDAREYACSSNAFSTLTASDEQVGAMDAARSGRRSYKYLMQSPGIILAR